MAVVGETMVALVLAAEAQRKFGGDSVAEFVRNAEAGVVEKGWFEGRGPIAILLIVLVGGLALNLTMIWLFQRRWRVAQ